MSTVKRTLVNVSFYDPEAIQRKLEQMAARGWMIQKAAICSGPIRKSPRRSSDSP